MAGIWNSSGCP